VSGEVAEMGELEKERLAREASLGPDIRLSCQVTVESDLTVRVISTASSTGMTAGPRPADSF
jgi:ferredoxin